MKKKIFILLLLVLLLVLAASRKPAVWQNSCAGCGDCANICPVGAISIINGKAVIDHDKCIDCKLCVSSCKFKAIR